MRKQICLRSQLWVAVLLATCFLLQSVPRTALGDESLLCAAVVDDSWLGAPIMDGIVERFPVSTSPDPADPNNWDPSGFKSDPGWDGATKTNLTYANELGSPTGAIPGKLYVGDTNNALYLGIVIQLDTSPFVEPGENDILVLALSTDQDPAKDWRIHVHPFKASQITQDFKDGKPDVVQAWRNSEDWNESPSSVEINPAWLADAADNIKIAKSGVFWSMEMRIPKHSNQDNGINLPVGSGTFRVYVNVIETSSLQTTYVQNPWPAREQAAIRQRTEPPYNIQQNTPRKDRTNDVSRIDISEGVATAMISSSSPQPFYENDMVTMNGFSGYSGPYRITNVANDSFSFPAPTGALSVTGSGSATVTVWGTVSVADLNDCTGISITQSDIGVLRNNALSNLIDIYNPTQTDGSDIYPESIAECETRYDDQSLNLQGLEGPENTFEARTRNSSSHKPSNFQAIFRLSQYGISAVRNFQAIGLEVETPDGDIPPAGTPSIPGDGKTQQKRKFNWLESCKYALGNILEGKPHQCLLVELDSTDPAVRFLKRSVWRNMDFQQASRMERSAVISSKGLEPPAQGQEHQFLLRVSSQIQSFNSGPIKERSDSTSSQYGSGAGNNCGRKLWTALGSEDILKEIPSHYPRGISEAMLWTTHGLVLNGSYLEIRGRRYQEARFVGGFGYVAGHLGAVADWEWDFSGDGVEETIPNELFALNLAPGQDAIVETTIVAEEPRWEWWQWLLLIGLLILLIMGSRSLFRRKHLSSSH